MTTFLHTSPKADSIVSPARKMETPQICKRNSDLHNDNFREFQNNFKMKKSTGQNYYY